jgi:cytochrome c5
MVITQEQGKYSIDRLPPGNYVVQAIGGERQSDPSNPVEVASGKASSINLSLTVARAPALPPAWPGRSPGERGEEAAAAAGGVAPGLAEGEGKAIIEAKCTTCHDTQRIVRSRANEARWQQVLSTMTSYAQGSTLAKPLTGDEQKVLLAYLSTNYAAAPGSARQKPDQFSRLPRTLLPPEARGYKVVEYELTKNTSRQPAAHRSSASMPSGAAITASCGWSTAAPIGAF